jgi:hypothetical protein
VSGEEAARGGGVTEAATTGAEGEGGPGVRNSGDLESRTPAAAFSNSLQSASAAVSSGGCSACSVRNIARITSTHLSRMSSSSDVTCSFPARTSSRSDSTLWVNAVIAAKPNVALPPLMEWAPLKIVLMPSESTVPVFSFRSAASMASRDSKHSSKKTPRN